MAPPLARVSRLAWRVVRSPQALRIALGLAVAALFVLLVFWRTNLDELRASLPGVSLPLLAAAVALYFVNIGLQALRWHFLIRHMGSPGPASLLPPLCIGIMGSNLLPLRMGMVFRAEYLHTRFRLQAPAVFTTMAIEGWLDGLVLALLFLPILALLGTQETIVRAVLFSGGLAAATLLLFRLAFTQRWARFWRSLRLPLPPLPFPQRLRSQLLSLLDSLATGLASVRSAPNLAAAAFITALAWLVKAGVFYLVGLAFSLDVQWTGYLVLTAAISASGAVQVSQGNTGPYEFVVAEVMAGLGALRGAATAYAIVSHAVLFIPVTLCGLALFAWHRLRAPAHLRPGPDYALTNPKDQA